MSQAAMGQERFRRVFLLLCVVGVSVLFFRMIGQFVVALVLAAITAALCRPLHRRLAAWSGGRGSLAAAATVVVVFLLIVGPVMGLASVVVAQAVDITRMAQERLARGVERPDDWFDLVPQWVPFRAEIETQRGRIAEAARDAAARAGSFMVLKLSAMAKGTLAFFFDLFIMLYALYFFLTRGESVAGTIAYYTPLPERDKRRLAERFLAVARATLKGTLAIGLLQGLMSGIGFAVVGIRGAAFWGTIMGIFSAIPGIGPILVWGPAVAYLILTGRVGAGVGLGIYCGLFVGMIDNFLRPRLVGRETRLPDLLVLIGTLGGIFMFGAVGIVLGPIVAAMFVTIWEFYGEAFRGVLSEPEAPAGTS
jgi:predicted PurR-regulated permease PerM